MFSSFNNMAIQTRENTISTRNWISLDIWVNYWCHYSLCNYRVWRYVLTWLFARQLHNFYDKFSFLEDQTVMKVKPLSLDQAKNGTKNGPPDVLWLDVSSLPVYNKPAVMNKTLAYR